MRLELIIVNHSAGVLRVSSVGTVVIKLLLERNGQKRKTKQRKKRKRGYRKQIHNLWKEMGMFEIEEQHIACQVRSLFQEQ